MAGETKITIHLDDKFTKKTLSLIRGARKQAQGIVNKQRKDLHKNWMEWAAGVGELKQAGFTGLGGGRGRGGGARRERKFKKRDSLAEAMKRVKKIKAKRLSLKGVAVGGAAAAGRGAGALAARAFPAAVAGISAVAGPLGVGVAAIAAAYVLAKQANEGLAVLAGAIGSEGLEELTNAMGEQVFDIPGMAIAAAGKTSSLSIAFAKAKVPLTKEQMKGVADFAYAEDGWRKQRERRDSNQLGESMKIVFKEITGFGGG